MPRYSDDDVLSMLADHNKEWEWYSAKGKAEVNMSEGDYSGSAYLRMKADSATWIMVKKIGVEVLRLSANTDRIHVKNRLERDYFTTSINEIHRHVPIALDYLDLQHFLLGNVFLPEGQYEITPYNRYYRISFNDGGTFIEHFLNGYTGYLDMSTYTVGAEAVKVEYDDYKEIDSGEKMPHFRKITRFYNGTEVEHITYSAKKITLNEPVKMPFKIPVK